MGAPLTRERSGITVRLASLDEAPAVREIMLASYADYRGVLAVESSAHSETVADVLGVMRQGGAVLATKCEQVVGSARFVVEDTHLYVGRVSVLPAHRRRGVASSMMRFLEDVALRRDRTAICVGVRDSLRSNVAFYESLGYEAGRIDPHPRGPDRVVTMVKTIRSASDALEPDRHDRRLQ